MKKAPKKKPAPVHSCDVCESVSGDVAPEEVFRATRSDGRSVAVTVPGRSRADASPFTVPGSGTEAETAEMLALANEVIATEIERLADAILTAANEPPITRWERADLWIALRLSPASVWTVALDDMEFQAPTVVEALRGLLALITAGQ
jgi:hypothetical protein